MSGGTLLLALYIPDADPTVIDPDALADEIADAINDQQVPHGSYGLLSPVEVSAIPGPQWVTAESLARLRVAADTDLVLAVRDILSETDGTTVSFSVSKSLHRLQAAVDAVAPA